MYLHLDRRYLNIWIYLYWHDITPRGPSIRYIWTSILAMPGINPHAQNLDKTLLRHLNIWIYLAQKYVSKLQPNTNIRLENQIPNLPFQYFIFNLPQIKVLMQIYMKSSPWNKISIIIQNGKTPFQYKPLPKIGIIYLKYVYI